VIYIYDNEKDVQKEPLIAFINKKCGIEIPMLTKKEKKLVRKTGMSPINMRVSLSILIIDFIFVSIFFLLECKVHTFMEVYLRNSLKEFCGTHIFLMLAVPVVIIGIWGEVSNFIPLRVILESMIYFGFKM